jgi:L-threonylcarbamoyladenylate synthase
MTILKIAEDDFEDAAEIAAAIIKGGGTVAYPADTVYGIGADAESEGAVAKIRAMKGVEAGKPLSVMVADLGMIEYYCDTGIWEDIILRKYLPGPYTFILKRKRDVAACGGSGTIGVRIPDSGFCQALCQKAGRPVVTTSANLTGQPAPTRFGDIDPNLLARADLAVDGGPTKYGASSTIIDLAGGKMLRRGDRDWVELSGLPER